MIFFRHIAKFLSDIWYFIVVSYNQSIGIIMRAGLSLVTGVMGKIIVRKAFRFVFSFMLIFLISTCAFEISKEYIMGYAIIGSDTMAPTIEQNEIFLYKPLNDRLKISYGDIIITDITYGTNNIEEYNEHDNHISKELDFTFDLLDIPIAYNIERVLALPGDTVRIENGLIYVNGNLIEEDYIFYGLSPSISYADFILGKGQYFSLPDNRKNAKCDYVVYENIEGVIIYK